MRRSVGTVGLQGEVCGFIQQKTWGREGTKGEGASIDSVCVGVVDTEEERAR